MKPKHLIIPSTPLARRIGDIFHRRHTTGWNVREVQAFKSIFATINLIDLANVERRYRTLWPPNRNKNSLRHDLETLLNHWPGEVDRANAWCDANPEKKTRVVIPMPPTKSEPYNPTPEEIAERERFEAQFSVYKKVKKTMEK